MFNFNVINEMVTSLNIHPYESLRQDQQSGKKKMSKVNEQTVHRRDNTTSLETYEKMLKLTHTKRKAN